MMFCRDYLTARRRDGLYRELAPTELLDGMRVLRDGRECLLLCGNDYLGLAQHAEVKQAAGQAALLQGTGAGGSRLISGSYPATLALEQELADWKRTERALVFSSGYAANVGIISALVGRGDVVFSDRLNHASIIDGCRLSGALIIVYAHLDMADLAEKLMTTPCAGRRLIVTDGVFSMDGDIAPIDQLAELAGRYDALLMVDDAHALGTLGDGRGSAHYFGVADAVSLQMGTLSKSLGGVGGYVAASAELIDYLVNRSRSYIFSTALPPMTTAAAREALAVLRREPQRLRRLQENGAAFRRMLQGHGLAVPDGVTPIVPLTVGAAAAASELASRLEQAGILAGAVRPPTVPDGQSRLRLTVSALHSVEQLRWAAAEIARCRCDMK